MSTAPVAVFDSGVGGLSVLLELVRELPAESFLYYADSAHCPYGTKPRAEILARAAQVTETLLAQNAKLIVVACNTATIAAVESLRAAYPVSFVGMEPAIKPASILTRNGVVGVLATGSSLGGEKFHRLLDAHARGVRVITRPCPGWVERVEAGDLDSTATRAAVAREVEPLLAEGADVLVLGCTHYPFLRSQIEEVAGTGVQVLDTGAAVARQTRRVLEREGRLAPGKGPGHVAWQTSGDAALFARLRERLFTP